MFTSAQPGWVGTALYSQCPGIACSEKRFTGKGRESVPGQHLVSRRRQLVAILIILGGEKLLSNFLDHSQSITHSPH